MKMEITKIKLADLKPYEKNAKKHPERQIEQIKESIKNYGNNDPIAVDEDYVIIEGHGRYEALKELGYEYAECIVLKNLTEKQKKSYRLIHNKLTMNSEFDIDLLIDELAEIGDDLSFYDLADLSDDEVYDDGEIQDLKEPAEKQEKEIVCPHCGETFYL